MTRQDIAPKGAMFAFRGTVGRRPDCGAKGPIARKVARTRPIPDTILGKGPLANGWAVISWTGSGKGDELYQKFPLR